VAACGARRSPRTNSTTATHHRRPPPRAGRRSWRPQRSACSCPLGTPQV
jgi:hypothetical protein